MDATVFGGKTDPCVKTAIPRGASRAASLLSERSKAQPYLLQIHWLDQSLVKRPATLEDYMLSLLPRFLARSTTNCKAFTTSKQLLSPLSLSVSSLSLFSLSYECSCGRFLQLPWSKLSVSVMFMIPLVRTLTIIG